MAWRFRVIMCNELDSIVLILKSFTSFLWELTCPQTTIGILRVLIFALTSTWWWNVTSFRHMCFPVLRIPGGHQLSSTSRHSEHVLLLDSKFTCKTRNYFHIKCNKFGEVLFCSRRSKRMLRSCFINLSSVLSNTEWFILKCFGDNGHRSYKVFCIRFSQTVHFTSLIPVTGFKSTSSNFDFRKTILKTDVLEVRSLSVQMCVQVHQLNTSC